MDRDTVIALAREARLEILNFDGEDEVGCGDGYHIQTDLIERFAALVAAEKDKEIKMLANALKREQKKNEELISSMETAVRLALKAEREACAKVCEELELKSADGQLGTYVAGWSDGTDDCAAAIRSRT